MQHGSEPVEHHDRNAHRNRLPQRLLLLPELGRMCAIQPGGCARRRTKSIGVEPRGTHGFDQASAVDGGVSEFDRRRLGREVDACRMHPRHRQERMLYLGDAARAAHPFDAERDNLLVSLR